jgi:hypothetical protein
VKSQREVERLGAEGEGSAAAAEVVAAARSEDLARLKVRG